MGIKIADIARSVATSAASDQETRYGYDHTDRRTMTVYPESDDTIIDPAAFPTAQARAQIQQIIMDVVKDENYCFSWNLNKSFPIAAPLVLSKLNNDECIISPQKYWPVALFTVLISCAAWLYFSDLSAPALIITPIPTLLSLKSLLFKYMIIFSKKDRMIRWGWKSFLGERMHQASFSSISRIIFGYVLAEGDACPRHREAIGLEFTPTANPMPDALLFSYRHAHDRLAFAIVFEWLSGKLQIVDEKRPKSRWFHSEFKRYEKLLKPGWWRKEANQNKTDQYIGDE